MIDFAARHVPGAIYMICDGQSVACRDNQFTAAFSSHVFQHFENRETAIAYFRELFRVLKPGGTMMIHVPIAILPFNRVWPVMGAIQALLWRTSDRWLGLKAKAKRWLIVHGNGKPFYRLVQYDPDWLYSQLLDVGFNDVHIWMLPVTAHTGEKVMGSYVFAKKPMETQRIAQLRCIPSFLTIQHLIHEWFAGAVRGRM